MQVPRRVAGRGHPPQPLPPAAQPGARRRSSKSFYRGLCMTTPNASGSGLPWSFDPIRAAHPQSEILCIDVDSVGYVNENPSRPQNWLVFRVLEFLNVAEKMTVFCVWDYSNLESYKAVSPFVGPIF